VVADGLLVFAGWSHGGEPGFRAKLPRFDDLLKQAGEERLGHLTRDGAARTILKDDFDGVDRNGDGKITRDEWAVAEAEMDYKASGRNVALALSPGGTGDVTGTRHVAWRVPKGGLPYLPSPLVYRGLLYTVTDQGRLSAYDVKTGKEVEDRKHVGLGQPFASPVAAGGYVYLCDTDGSVVVVRAGETPEKVWSAKLDDRIRATPAVAGNVLYVRTDRSLYAFAERE
jgi:outer membrane protein assembly factor BamB